MAASPKHWNPSGPPEGDQGLTEELLKAMEGEVVGETIYSKSWILSQLVKVFESLRSQRAVSPDCSRKDRDESPGYSKSDSEELLQDPDPVELEEHFEDELCQLWDASMNSDVSKFLCENNGVSLMLNAASLTRAPRLSEICVGIVNNVACAVPACKELTERPLIEKCLQLLASSDSRVLYETVRLLQTCLASKDTYEEWMKSVLDNEYNFRTAVKFILQSSTVDDLLCEIGTFLDAICYKSNDFLMMLLDNDFLPSLIEAVHQVKSSGVAVEEVVSFVMLLQMVSTVEEGVERLVQRCEEVTAILIWFITEEAEHVEDTGSHGNRCTGIHAACSLLLFYFERIPTQGPRDSDLIKAVKKLKRVFTEEEASSSTEDNSLRSPSAILTRLIEKICVESVCHK